jgi:hypothetical protein
MKLDTSDTNKEFARHSREDSDVENHQNSAKSLLQSAQQKGTVIRDAVNCNSEMVPMEQVRCYWLTATVTSHNVILNYLVSKCVPVPYES